MKKKAHEVQVIGDLKLYDQSDLFIATKHSSAKASRNRLLNGPKPKGKLKMASPRRIAASLLVAA